MEPRTRTAVGWLLYRNERNLPINKRKGMGREMGIKRMMRESEGGLKGGKEGKKERGEVKELKRER